MTYDNKDRRMALARAMKFQPLFNAKHFDAIVDAIQMEDVPPGTRKTEFDAAVAGITWLTAEEKGWLWNYLQHCEDVWDDPNVLDVAVAAKTGW